VAGRRGDDRRRPWMSERTPREAVEGADMWPAGAATTDVVATPPRLGEP